MHLDECLCVNNILAKNISITNYLDSKQKVVQTLFHITCEYFLLSFFRLIPNAHFSKYFIYFTIAMQMLIIQATDCRVFIMPKALGWPSAKSPYGVIISEYH